MSAVATGPNPLDEITIFARVLGIETDRLPAEIARYFLDLQLDHSDRMRMHVLAIRNQNDELSEAERAEMHAYGKAATLLSLLKSKARLTLNVGAPVLNGS